MVLLTAMEREQTPADCRGLEWFTTLELRPPGPGAEVLGFFFFFFQLKTKQQRCCQSFLLFIDTRYWHPSSGFEARPEWQYQYQYPVGGVYPENIHVIPARGAAAAGIDGVRAIGPL